jgi:hypothetical protein
MLWIAEGIPQSRRKACRRIKLHMDIRDIGAVLLDEGEKPPTKWVVLVELIPKFALLLPVLQFCATLHEMYLGQVWISEKMESVIGVEKCSQFIPDCVKEATKSFRCWLPRAKAFNGSDSTRELQAIDIPPEFCRLEAFAHSYAAL